MQNWDDYRLILAIHKGKTLRKAAYILGVNHATVSRRLATLNMRIGSCVAEPTSSGYQLTPLGEKLLISAQKIDTLVVQDKLFERAHQLDLVGEITLSVPPPILQFLLLDELIHFKQSHPHIKLNIDTSYDLANLDKCEADVVVRVSNSPDEHLVGNRLFPIATQFYATQEYLDNTPPEQYQWITHTNSFNKPGWVERSPYPKAKVVLSVSDLTLRHQMANKGHGMIRGACYIAPHFQNLVGIKNSKPTPYQDLWVLSHPNLAHTPRIKELKAFLVDCLRAKKTLIIGQNLTINK